MSQISVDPGECFLRLAKAEIVLQPGQWSEGVWGMVRIVCVLLVEEAQDICQNLRMLFPDL